MTSLLSYTLLTGNTVRELKIPCAIISTPSIWVYRTVQVFIQIFTREFRSSSLYRWMFTTDGRVIVGTIGVHRFRFFYRRTSYCRRTKTLYNKITKKTTVLTNTCRKWTRPFRTSTNNKFSIWVSPVAIIASYLYYCAARYLRSRWENCCCTINRILSINRILR